MGHPSESDIERSKTALLEEIEELHARVGEPEHAEAECQRVEAALGDREALFSLIAELAKDAIVCIDSTQRIVLFNRGAEEIFGHESEAAIGQPLAMLLPERNRDGHPAHLEAFEASEESARFMGGRAEIQGLREDGTEFPAEASISAFQLGGERYFAAVLRDVTGRKEAEETLRRNEEQMQAHLLELQDTRDQFEAQGMELVGLCEDLAKARDAAVLANHAKSQFLAHMSHEIRTPLNAILGFSEIVGDELLGPVSPPKYREYAQDIHTSGRHLLELINDILDLAKIEAGKLEIHDGDVDVAHAVESSLRFVKERAADLPVLRADERMAKQMLINLLTNAVKFTRKGGEVTVLAALDGHGALRLSVRDTGVGIAAADIPKIMESFGQADNARAGVTEGTGLGLPLVKAMIEMHGGTLELDSEFDVGTTVTICFPPERIAEGRRADVA
jgi:PAS domain S-box-containing protein